MITNDTSVQWLQYRVLHRILPVNYYLKQIKIIANDYCTFCKEEIETIQHVFFLFYPYGIILVCLNTEKQKDGWIQSYQYTIWRIFSKCRQ